MRADHFRDSPAGTVVPIPEGGVAFVPRPLPRELLLDPPLIRLLDEASRKVAMLAGVGETLPNPYLLTRPFVGREAVLSSRIEGTQASQSDLYRFEVSTRREGQDDVREVANYVRALEQARERLDHIPIGRRLIDEAHRQLLEGVRGGGIRRGHFRGIQVWIGSGGPGIEDARFVPPPPDRLPGLMADWERFANDPGMHPPLIANALLHYQFETIHPYQDGNGRIGRMLIVLHLIAAGVLPLPLLYLSAYFERRREEYYDQLLAVSRTGEWEPWLEFFLRGVVEQGEDALVRSRALRNLHDRTRSRMQESGASANVLQVVEYLFASPVLTNRSVGERLGITRQGANRILRRLAEQGVVERIGGSQPHRYVANDILRAVEHPVSELSDLV
ncbi:MAG: Fic family protein [Chloroflexi bacterium]|nr:Fic family protein [Chloroflexota bacterium]